MASDANERGVAPGGQNGPTTIHVDEQNKVVNKSSCVADDSPTRGNESNNTEVENLVLASQMSPATNKRAIEQSLAVARADVYDDDHSNYSNAMSAADGGDMIMASIETGEDCYEDGDGDNNTISHRNACTVEKLKQKATDKSVEMEEDANDDGFGDNNAISSYLEDVSTNIADCLDDTDDALVMAVYALLKMTNGEIEKPPRQNYSKRSCLPPATSLMQPCPGWESGRQLPVEDYPGRYWNSVLEKTKEAITQVLGRPAKVFFEEDTWFEKQKKTKKKELTMFINFGRGCDVVLIHDAIDILVANCTLETDMKMRKALETSGFPAAMEVLRAAEKIQEGGPLFNWIVKECKYNPVHQTTKSPGVTADFGLHDNQMNRVIMLQTELEDKVRPPGSKYIRAKTYADHREKFLLGFPERDRDKVLGPKNRMSMSSKGNSGKSIMLPYPRINSLPSQDDDVAQSAAIVEGLCRASASDISTRYFNSLPGVRELSYVQESLKWAEGTMLEANEICPFEGFTDYLYAKGSMSLQPTKRWHDDANGPACLTCWQNFGDLAGKLQLVIAIHGYNICINSGIGKIVHFMAWLPHCTREKKVRGKRRRRRSGSGKRRRSSGVRARLHHTAYTKTGTEYISYILNEYRHRKLRLNMYTTK